MTNKFYSRATHIVWLARHHWQTRRTYRHLPDWLCSIYSNLALLVASVPWPGGGVIRAVDSPFLDGPTLLRLGTSDWMMFEELLCGGEYEPLFKSEPAGTRVILDLGANVGISLKLWQKAFPETLIVAVEPDPANLAIARRNAGTSVQFIQAGAGAHAGRFFLGQSGPSCGYKMSDQPMQSDDIAVDVLTIPQILEAAHIKGQVDLLKCDIEGSESTLFKNCGPWIKSVQHVVVELHAPYSSEEFLNDIRHSGSDLAEYHRIDKGPLQVLFLKRCNEAA